MNEKVLVAYASKYGATREIAERIGDVLVQAGLNPDVKSAAELRDLGRYRAVVLGSALYVGKWPGPAVAFLKNYLNQLASLPVWLFSSGPTGDGDPEALVNGVLYPPSLKSIIEQLNPRDMAVFHGCINTEKINAIEKWAIKSVVRKPFGDYRDWNAIQNWAETIAETIKSASL